MAHCARHATMSAASPGQSNERRSILNPVLVAAVAETTRIVVVDGFQRGRIATDRGDAMMRARRAALEVAGVKLAMIATNAGLSGHRAVLVVARVMTACATIDTYASIKVVMRHIVAKVIASRASRASAIRSDSRIGFGNKFLDLRHFHEGLERFHAETCKTHVRIS